MAVSKGESSVTLSDILEKTTEANILSFYLGVTEIPCIIHSPLRKDNRPSFGLYSPNGKRIYFVDFATKDRGGIFDLLCQMWGCSYKEVLIRINKDIPKLCSIGTPNVHKHIPCTVRSTIECKKSTDLQCKSYKEVLIRINKDIPKLCSIGTPNVHKHIPCTVRSTIECKKSTDLQCKVRDWASYDVEYWESYGISLDWLKYAEVYPISHKIIIKNGNKYVFKADKYAYAYVEHKEGKVTLKVYQPFNKDGYKWSSNIDRSVWSLWTKIPKFGNNLIISSSVKDCLNIMCNLGIPAICMQGEGYKPKPQIIEELKSRYKNIILFYDNDYNNPDNPGKKDSMELSLMQGEGYKPKPQIIEELKSRYKNIILFYDNDYNNPDNPGKKDSMELSLEYNLKRVEIPVKYESKDPSDLFKKYGRNRYLEIMNEILKDVLWKSGEV